MCHDSYSECKWVVSWWRKKSPIINQCSTGWMQISRFRRFWCNLILRRPICPLHEIWNCLAQHWLPWFSDLKKHILSVWWLLPLEKLSQSCKLNDVRVKQKPHQLFVMLLFLAITLRPIADPTKISIKMLSSLWNFLLESLASTALSTLSKVPECVQMVQKFPWKVSGKFQNCYFPKW